MSDGPIIQYSYPNWQKDVYNVEASKQLSGEIKAPGLWSLLYQSVKAAVKFRFTGYGGWTGQNWGNGWNWSWGGVYNGSKIDYALEAGDLTKSSLVMAAVNWFGRVLAEAPLQVVEADADGKEKPIIGHPAIKLLNRPNDFYTGAVLWKSVALSWIINGNPYLLKVRDGFGRVIQLWYVPPSMICPRWPEDGSEFITHYEYQVDGRIQRIEVEDAIHFRNGVDPNNMGRTGLSPVASVYREICADSEVATYQFLLLKQGGMPPVGISLKEGLNSQGWDEKKVKDTFIRSTSGDERGKVFVSNKAVEITKLGFAPKEMDLGMLRHVPESRLASVIGIAKETLGYGAADNNSTYNNVQQADERSIETFVKPFWAYVEDELTHQLGPDFGFEDNQRFRFDLSQVAALQEDQDKLHERARGDLASGAITVNEFREMTGWKLLDKEVGDVFLRQSTVQAVTPEMQKASIASAIMSHKQIIRDDPADQDNPANQNTDPDDDPPRRPLMN